MTLVEAAPPQGTAIRSWVVGSVDDLPVVRAEIQAALDLPDAGRIVLVASELVTNALRHGRPPVTVRLLRDGEGATLDVVDRLPDIPPVVAGERPPGTGGFGLLLAGRAAHDVGWWRCGDSEKHVWARFLDVGRTASTAAAVAI